MGIRYSNDADHNYARRLGGFCHYRFDFLEVMLFYSSS